MAADESPQSKPEAAHFPETGPHTLGGRSKIQKHLSVAEFFICTLGNISSNSDLQQLSENLQLQILKIPFP